MRLSFDLEVKDAKKLLIWLLGFELLLVAIYALDNALGMPIWTLHSLFDLDAEQTIPDWFSALQLALVGLVFMLKARQPDVAHGLSPRFILLVGAGFLFLSADEAASIHERIGALLKKTRSAPGFKGGHGLWMLPYAVLGLLLLWANLRSVAIMLTRYRRASLLMLGGFGVILVGAVGLEALSYQYLRGGDTPGLYVVEVACEEFLEMFGASVMLYGALQFLMDKPAADAGKP